jgi:hypothetical protein
MFLHPGVRSLNGIAAVFIRIKQVMNILIETVGSAFKRLTAGA